MDTVVGAKPDLGDLAVEPALRIGVDREVRGITVLDAADIGFIDRGLDLDLGQILGDLKQIRGLEARGQGLADRDAALE